MEAGFDLDIDERQDSAALRWRLILGQDADPSKKAPPMNGEQMSMDEALEAIYSEKMDGSSGNSMPSVNKWLGDIRKYFPQEIVQVLQEDVMERIGLERILREPELFEALVPDVQLVSQLIALSELIPEQSRSTARILVQQLADQLSRQLAPLFRQEVKGSLQKMLLNRHPSLKEMDWNRTIMANLRHYQPEYKTIIPEKKIGNKRIRKGLKKVILVVDQSASMADSVVYAGIIACILAKLPALDTHLILFDSEYTDMSDQLDDPVDLLFGVQLGGGTDIGLALKYAGTLVESPADTLIFLISDLDEGVDTDEMMAQAFRIVQSGATLTTILNLSDQGDANWHATNAKAFRQLGVPCLCSDPSSFPKVLAESLLSKR